MSFGGMKLSARKIAVLLSAVIAVLMLIGCQPMLPDQGTVTTEKSETHTAAGFKYSVSDDSESCTIVGIATDDVENIVIPEKLDRFYVREIGWGAFMWHSEIVSVDIPEGVREIGECAFYGCTNLLSIDIPDSVTALGTLAFDNCTSLESVKFGSGLTDIPGCAFYSCRALRELVIPEGIETIGEYAFIDCKSLQSVEFPKSLKFIGSRAFDACSNIDRIVIADLASWLNVVFQDVTSAPNYYGVELWLGDEQIIDMTVPQGVEKIGSQAVLGCKHIKSVVIPDGVTSLEIEAFYGCSSIVSVVIPKSVTMIGTYSFFGASGLESVFYEGTPNDWAEIEIGSVNEWNRTGVVFFYSPSRPTKQGNYWHYVDGTPTRW